MSLWIVNIERTESFNISIELEGDGSESEAVKKAKLILINDPDMGAQWSDSLEITSSEAWED